LIIYPAGKILHGFKKIIVTNTIGIFPLLFRSGYLLQLHYPKGRKGSVYEALRQRSRNSLLRPSLRQLPYHYHNRNPRKWSKRQNGYSRFAGQSALENYVEQAGL